MPVWILVIEWLARIILFVLVCLSVWSVTIILERRKFFKDLENKDNLDDLKKCIESNSFTNLSSDGFRTQVLKYATLGTTHESVEKMVNSFVLLEKKKLEKGLSVLGTLGSTTPFIGLLGTIMGIIVSFGELSLGKGDMNQVMYSLAEALILTAVGLFVAIPAVVAFNIYSKKLKNLLVDGESIKDYYLAHKKV
ncbi:MAG: MotA/TolQ/ExbB proton channel family protein [Bacteriovoracaceae bacterium]